MSMTRRQLVFALPATAALQTQQPVYDVRRLGSLQAAIDAASQAGGGTVYVPAGRIVSGTVRLRSHVSVWLDNGATLAMSPEESAFDEPESLPYDPHADRATSLFRNALIAGEDLENVAIFGQGAIDGNRARGGGPKSIALKRCRNVSIRGITMLNGPSYNISLLGCEHVDIEGVSIRNGYSDGIDPDCCKFVRISNCFVESVDDAICLKASPALGERVSTEHVTITNCVLRTASIHVKCGTESYGDFRNIAISNCAFVGGMGNRHGNPGIGLYTVDGGTLESVVVSNITMQNVGVPVALMLGARGRGQATPQPGTLRNVQITNVIASGARRPSVIAGLRGAAVRNVLLADIRVSTAPADSGPESLDAVPEKPTGYPDPTMFGPLPASGLFIRHAGGITVRDFVLETAAGERRAGLTADDVSELRLSSVRASLWLNNAQSSLTDCEMPARITNPRPGRPRH